MTTQISRGTSCLFPPDAIRARCDGAAEYEVENTACEERLLSGAMDGDASAFGELVRQRRGICMKVALSILRNRCDAEDEVQNAFSKAFQHVQQFRGEGDFTAWLSRIVENQCLMRIRQDKRARFVYLDNSTQSDYRIELIGQAPVPEDELGTRQVRELLMAEISRIPPLFRNVMLLRYVEELSIDDVASRLGLSIPAAKSRLLRAKTELRSRLQRHCGRKGSATLTHGSKQRRAMQIRLK